MKKIFSVILGITLVGSMSINPEIKAEPSDYVSFNSRDIVLFKTQGRGEFLGTPDGNKVCKTKEIPEVLIDKDTEFCNYYWIDCADPYVMEVKYGDPATEPYLKETDIIPEVKYVFDMVNSKVTDYITGELVYDFSVNKVINVAYTYKQYGKILHWIVLEDYLITDGMGEPIGYGDINADKTVDLTDLSLLSLYLLREYEFRGFQNNVSDINNDGETDICDFAVLKQIIMHDDVKIGETDEICV